jgi:hypothetical protein
MIKHNHILENFHDSAPPNQPTQAQVDALKAERDRRNKELGAELALRNFKEWQRLLK